VPGRYAPALKLGKEAAVPNYDVIVYPDLSSLVASVRAGDPARELGDIFGEDMFVSGVYPPLHEGKDATVVISGRKHPPRSRTGEASRTSFLTGSAPVHVRVSPFGSSATTTAGDGVPTAFFAVPDACWRKS